MARSTKQSPKPNRPSTSTPPEDLIPSDQTSTVQDTSPLLIDPSHPMPTVRPHLIASLGNPGPKYARTRHSAGHLILNELIRHTSAPTPVRKAASGRQKIHGKALVSQLQSPPVTFYESPAYMNVSGPPVAAAWSSFISEPENKEMKIQGASPALVVLHDELELDPGKFKIRKDSTGSARGHNGLKSLLASSQLHGTPITRVGIGIGRPKSRDSNDVAQWVLANFKPQEEELVKSCAPKIWKELGF